MYTGWGGGGGGDLVVYSIVFFYAISFNFSDIFHDSKQVTLLD